MNLHAGFHACAHTHVKTFAFHVSRQRQSPFFGTSPTHASPRGPPGVAAPPRGAPGAAGGGAGRRGTPTGGRGAALHFGVAATQGLFGAGPLQNDERQEFSVKIHTT